MSPNLCPRGSEARDREHGFTFVELMVAMSMTVVLSVAALAAVACTVRVSGLFLVGALFVMLITTRRIGLRTRLGRLCWLLVPTAGRAAFVG